MKKISIIAIIAMSIFLIASYYGVFSQSSKSTQATENVEETRGKINANIAVQTPDDVASIPDDAQVTESGLARKILQKGTGKNYPRAFSRVKVHYSGWTTDGKMFDSSVQRGYPTSFKLTQVIPGWTEGVSMMLVGEKSRFWIPQKLAYRGMKGAPAGMLVFDIELLEIEY